MNSPGFGGPGFGAGSGSKSFHFTDKMLQGFGFRPLIPNLQFGLLFNFGDKVTTSRYTGDYLLPVSLCKDSTLFGEAHAEYQALNYQNADAAFNSKVDFTLGGGYRKILCGDRALLGVNAFFDSSRLGDSWFYSGGLGSEMAVKISDSDAIDVSFNWYGQLFDGEYVTRAFRSGPQNFDWEMGISHELWEGGPDFRVKMTGYQFEAGNRITGWKTGAELKSRDGTLSVKYDIGDDRVNNTYHTIGAFVNVGFQFDKLLKFENPVMKPEPIFKSPRNLRKMLAQAVRRDWHQSAAIAATTPTPLVPTSTAPYFIITFYDGLGGVIVSQTHWQTATDLVVTPAAPGCGIVFEGGGYDITIAGERPPGAITVNVLFEGNVAGDPFPVGCRGVQDFCNGNVYTVTIPDGATTVNVPACGFGVPYVYRATTCACADPPVTGFAGTITITDAAGVIPMNSVNVSTQP